jgi:hypothetical protein
VPRNVTAPGPPADRRQPRRRRRGVGRGRRAPLRLRAVCSMVRRSRLSALPGWAARFPGSRARMAGRFGRREGSGGGGRSFRSALSDMPRPALPAVLRRRDGPGCARASVAVRMCVQRRCDGGCFDGLRPADPTRVAVVSSLFSARQQTRVGVRRRTVTAPNQDRELGRRAGRGRNQRCRWRRSGLRSGSRGRLSQVR